MEKLYTNWLTDLLETVKEEESLRSFDLQPIAEAARMIDIRNRFEPTFLDYSKLDFVKKLIQDYEENSSSVTITIGILVKNQEDKIESTMASALNFCNHLIVVDTGSTDNTVSKINAYQSSKIKFYEIPWTGNFSEMRNKIIDLNTDKWLFFVDSDEIIDPRASFDTLKNVLNLVDIIFPQNSVCLQIKQWAAQYSSFSFIERIIRKSDETEYFGVVHEGVRAIKSDINLIHFEFSLSNKGSLDSEIKKFDKKEGYKRLTLEILEKEPNNPRWIANMTNPDENTPKDELEEYIGLLKRGLLTQPSRSVTLSNLRDSEYLHMIFGKYLLAHMMKGELDLTISESAVALKKFPMSTFILFIHHYAKYLKQDKEKKMMFEDLLVDLSAINAKEAEEVSQQKQDMIKSLLVKYMFDFQDYNAALRLLSEISDVAAMKNIMAEGYVLRNLVKLKNRTQEGKGHENTNG
jgi:glycosyltransferase involved in cell wall biosynthesis